MPSCGTLLPVGLARNGAALERRIRHTVTSGHVRPQQATEICKNIGERFLSPLDYFVDVLSSRCFSLFVSRLSV